MSVTYGFFDSPSASDKRVYSAKQFSEMFDGIITEGVFPYVGDAFAINTVSGSLAITLGSGKAWFKNTWTYNDATMTINLTAAHATYSRYDLLVLKVDKTPSVAKNTIYVVTGTPASSPVVPTLTNTATVFYYILARILVPAGVTDSTKTTITRYIGTTSVPFVKGIADADEHTPEQHNNVYRGKYLGSIVTDAQIAAIRAGTFKDLYIGDYWIDSNGKVFRIAGFDYWYGKGDQRDTRHHAVIVTDYNVTSQTYDPYIMVGNTDGYASSPIRTMLSTAINALNNADCFKDKILSRREFLVTTINGATGTPTAGTWVTTQGELLNEPMVFGSYIYAAGTSITDEKAFVVGRRTISTSQLPLFRIAPKHILLLDSTGTSAPYWLRDYVGNGNVCIVDQYGAAAPYAASEVLAVRAVMAIG